MEQQTVTPQSNGPSLNDPLKPILQKKETQDEPQSLTRSFFSTIVLIVGALAFALAINQFVFQSYEVEGSSMEPSLHNKDRLIIWKMSRTWSRLTKDEYTPARGDVIVFHKPDGSDEQLIKRVIGLPGERVVVHDGLMTVYNKQHPDGFRPDDAPYGKVLQPTTGNVDVNVNTGEVFVSGDNRIPGASLDSRSSLGNVPLKLVVGKLALRLFPFQDFELF